MKCFNNISISCSHFFNIFQFQSHARACQFGRKCQLNINQQNLLSVIYLIQVIFFFEPGHSVGHSDMCVEIIDKTNINGQLEEKGLGV